MMVVQEGVTLQVKKKYRAVVIGVSAGGLQALSQILPRLATSFDLPVLVVQHLSRHSDTYLIEHLQSLSTLRVKLAEDKEPIVGGVVYIAPPDYHLLVEEEYSLALSTENRVNYSRPSIDVLFASAAEVYTDSLIGVILTGANADGSEGLLRIQSFGGLVIVQDPATAVAATMPEAAIETVRVDYVLPVAQIGNFLNQLVGGN